MLAAFSAAGLEEPETKYQALMIQLGSLLSLKWGLGCIDELCCKGNKKPRLFFACLSLSIFRAASLTAAQQQPSFVRMP